MEQAISPLQADAVAMTARDKHPLHNSQSQMKTTTSELLWLSVITNFNTLLR